MSTQDLAAGLEKLRSHWRPDSNEELTLRYSASELRMMERKIVQLEEEIKGWKAKVAKLGLGKQKA